MLSCLPGTWWAWGSHWWAIRKRSWAAYRLWEPRCCISTAQVSRCDGLQRAASQRVKTKTELIRSSAWDVPGIIVKVNGHLLCLTLSAVSGVKAFLCSSLKDCGPTLLWPLKRGKGQKKQQQKRNYLDETTPFFVTLFSFLFRSAYELNHISNGALERSLMLTFL